MFQTGQYIVYVNGDCFEIGRIKVIFEDRKKAFVCYHSGETAALTDFADMHPIMNERWIEKTSLGGEIWKEENT